MPLATRSLADHPVRQLPLDQVLGILVQIMDGLIHIHDRGYIHRDLKPPNVLLTEHGDELEVVVADFGISARGPTHTGKSGTRSWMSPEVQMGVMHDNKVDAYALGLMLWWMLFGSTYFKDSDTVPKVIDWDVVAKEDLLVSDFLHKLLEESPARRWTVKAARWHPLVGHILSSTRAPVIGSEGSATGGAAPSNGNASTSTVPELHAGWTSVTPTETMENGPIDANLSVFIVEGMLLNDVSTSSDVLSTPSPSLLASARPVKHKRDVSISNPLQVTTDDAPSAKRWKANPSTNNKEIKNEGAWTLNHMWIKSYIKSVWGFACEWRQGW
ncbi:hypothetical protein FRB94_014383 [Tulasnella sp. JGI-2019a]|nr:hypothetical protein FRB94_014383 [Tulasnella sp. JGI-2019a]